LRRERARQGAAPAGLRAAVLVTAAAERRRGLIEVDYALNLLARMHAGKGNSTRVLNSCRMVTIEEVNDALREVIDPELGLDFVELGLIYEVEVEEPGAVKVTFTLTSPGCPIGPQVTEQIEEFVSEIDGVQSVASEMTFSPPWTPERMSEDAKFALGF
jgi:metal-sulfur cluster biosynthetic enzyme